jgi:hypothetical protein
MEIDLYRDWVTHLKNELAAFGYDTTQMQSPESAVHTFLNLTKRLVTPTPRTVLKAQNFSCPPELAAGLTEVERKISSGEDLSPHLSRLLRNPSFNDPLLNDWGIHHVHLGTTVDSDGFVVRTGPVLFARFDNVNAYLIDVLPHGSWSLQRLVKELHDNWPDSIKYFRLNGVLGLAMSVSDKDVATLRKGNVNTMVDLGGGIVYALIGGGYSTSGLSTEVVIQSDRYARRLRQMQQAIVQNIEAIAREATAKGVAFPKRPRFELQIDDGNLYAVEVNCTIAVPLGKL